MDLNEGQIFDCSWDVFNDDFVRRITEECVDRSLENFVLSILVRLFIFLWVVYTLFFQDTAENLRIDCKYGESMATTMLNIGSTVDVEELEKGKEGQ